MGDETPFAKQRRRARRGATRGYNEAVGVRAYLFRADRLVLEDAERLCDILGLRSVGTVLNAFLAHWVKEARQDPETKQRLAERNLHLDNMCRTFTKPKGYLPVGREDVMRAEAQWEARASERAAEAWLTRPGPPPTKEEIEEEEARRLSREGTEEETPL